MSKELNVIFATNLDYFMSMKGVDRTQLCAELGFKYSTVSEWLSAKKYPRMDKIEMLAEYFGVKKSDLIEPSFPYIIQGDEPKTERKNTIVKNKKEPRSAAPLTAALSGKQRHDGIVIQGSAANVIVRSRRMPSASDMSGSKRGKIIGARLAEDHEIFIEKDKAFERVVAAYDKLNSLGKEQAADRIEELAEIEKYKK